MYQFLSQISNLLSEPFLTISRSTESLPLLSAFILGIVGALAPCQFTGNLGAITIYVNQSMQNKLAWKEVLYFVLGKIVVFSGIGILVWMIGNEMKDTLVLFFPWMRKIVGPLLIIIGLFMIGVIKFTKTISLGRISDRFTQKGNLGAFLMGVSFSLGFCPTMFVLFFLTLMPMAMAVPYGPILPGIFALGTSVPVIVSVFLIWYFELSGKLMKKKGRKLGVIVQRIAGFVLLILGILDTLTYWSL
ncbi:MAG: sulfite exporter TauE/SafE family protein [Bacillota bacterium]|nr:sulfite exporter TauE/SafE family protein [Bacillota bacterium]MDP4169315.1 sulfite exporter TauE/SafE family protein [Bacillota bacterium]